jgi:hypothetical protein
MIINPRDFTLARIASAWSTVRSLDEDLRGLMELFHDPEDDTKGRTRAEILESCELGCHALMTYVQAAKEGLSAMSPTELAAGEEDDGDPLEMDDEEEGEDEEDK